MIRLSLKVDLSKQKSKISKNDILIYDDHFFSSKFENLPEFIQLIVYKIDALISVAS